MQQTPTPNPETNARWKEDAGAAVLLFGLIFVLWCLSQPATTIVWWQVVTR